MKKFFLHYNKPASQRLGKHMWSVHWNKVCHIVDEINCQQPTYSKARKRQPYLVMEGKTRLVTVGIVNGIKTAYII